MKRIIAILLTVLLLGMLTACDQNVGRHADGIIKADKATFEIGKTHSSFEGMNIQIANAIWDDEEIKLDVNWINKTGYDVVYGSSYDIERENNGEWSSCVTLEDLAFTSIGYELKAGATQKKTYNLTDVFDISQDGKYRLTTDCFIYDKGRGGKSTECELWVEFTVTRIGDTSGDVKKTFVDFVPQYIRTNGYYEDVEYPVVKIIRSVDELNSYYNENKEKYSLERREDPASDSTIGFLDAFGPQLRRLLTLDQRLHTGGKELQARISRLTAQYQQLAASTKYQVQGETLSGGQLRFALTSTHRERRKAAYDAQQQTAVENGPVMEKLLRELVHARNQLARENGFDSFADYGDLSMQRLGYGRAELDEFCRQVQKYITPLYLQMQEQQRQRLGVETLLPYDRALVFPEGNAVPVAAEELPKAAGRMYHALSPEAGHFFDEMVRHDLLDVAGSPNKISGMGFCDMLGAPCGMPFIFANCDGTGSDVTVYTHELGHGLQGYLSYRSQPLADYVGLSPDLAEVHSKTMELLTLPYARDFFGPHAPQFLTEHRYDFIKELCAFCSIHTFETWLYEHPDASLSQWAEEFDRTEKAFGRAQNNEPWRQQVLAGCDLFTNMAIYMLPRYVVSYALSIVCAQQLKAAYDADPVDGWARYHALCASGGSKLYAETLAAAGLELPYAPGVVERLARELAAQA